MTEAEDRAVARAWKDYAEACLEHDCLLGRHACEDLTRLAAACPPVVISTQGV